MEYFYDFKQEVQQPLKLVSKLLLSSVQQISESQRELKLEPMSSQVVVNSRMQRCLYMLKVFVRW